MNRASEVIRTSFRPKMSLNLAKTMRKPGPTIRSSIRLRRFEDVPTCVGDQVRSYDPATSIESLEIVRDSHQRRCNYCRLKTR